jgi:hypothetical protein
MLHHRLPLRSFHAVPRARAAARALSALLAALLTAAPAHAGPFVSYRFTPVADTQGGFPYKDIIGFPAINGSGRVAFVARLSSNVEGVFTRLGTTGGVTVLADTGVGPYGGFGIGVSISPVNTVLFSALEFLPNETRTVLLRGQGAVATPLLATTNGLSRFCGEQLNVQGTAVLRATRGDGTDAILAQGSGTLTGPQREVASTRSEFASLSCSPSIDDNGDVAFIATLPGGTRGVFVRNAHGGPLSQRVDSASGFFAGFVGVALNAYGGLAFQASLPDGTHALYRQRDGQLLRLADNFSARGDLAGFAINESGQVAWEVSFGANGSAVSVGPGRFLGRVLGPGSVMAGRTVLHAHLDRGALNSLGQMALWVLFTDGTSMVARGDPVRFPDVAIPVGSLQLSTGGGSSAHVETHLLQAAHAVTLDFDLTFLSLGGELQVKLGDHLVKAIPASAPGVRQHVRLQLDFAKSIQPHRPGASTALRLEAVGKPGLSLQVADVVVPGLLAETFGDSLDGWKVGGSGSAEIVDVTRYPLKFSLEPAAKEAGDKAAAAGASHRVVAVLWSDDQIDSTTDLDRSSLRLADQAPRLMAGSNKQACEAREGEGKRRHLACEFDLPGKPSADADRAWRLEAATPLGFGVVGRLSP